MRHKISRDFGVGAAAAATAAEDDDDDEDEDGEQRMMEIVTETQNPVFTHQGDLSY